MPLTSFLLSTFVALNAQQICPDETVIAEEIRDDVLNAISRLEDCVMRAVGNGECDVDLERVREGLHDLESVLGLAATTCSTY